MQRLLKQLRGSTEGSGLKETPCILLQNQRRENPCSAGTGVNTDLICADDITTGRAGMAVNNYLLKRSCTFCKFPVNMPTDPGILSSQRSGWINACVDKMVIAKSQTVCKIFQKILVSRRHKGIEYLEETPAWHNRNILRPRSEIVQPQCVEIAADGRSACLLRKPSGVSLPFCPQEFDQWILMIAFEKGGLQTARHGMTHPLYHTVGIRAAINVVAQKNNPSVLHAAASRLHVLFDQIKHVEENGVPAMNVTQNINTLPLLMKRGIGCSNRVPFS